MTKIWIPSTWKCVLIFCGKLESAASTFVKESWSLKGGLDCLSILEPENWLSFEQEKLDFYEPIGVDIRLLSFIHDWNILIIQTFPKIFKRKLFLLTFLASQDIKCVGSLMQHSKWVSARATTSQLACKITRQIYSLICSPPYSTWKCPK